MIKVYKVPTEVTRDQLVALVGSEGSILNPILDNDDNLIISAQEWDGGEWQQYKAEYPEIAAQFVEIPYNPKPAPPFPPK